MVTISTNAFFNKDFGLNGCLFFTFVVIFVYQFDKMPDELVLWAMLGVLVTLPVGSLVCRRNTIFTRIFHLILTERQFIYDVYRTIGLSESPASIYSCLTTSSFLKEDYLDRDRFLCISYFFQRNREIFREDFLSREPSLVLSINFHGCLSIAFLRSIKDSLRSNLLCRSGKLASHRDCSSTSSLRCDRKIIEHRDQQATYKTHFNDFLPRLRSLHFYDRFDFSTWFKINIRTLGQLSVIAI